MLNTRYMKSATERFEALDAEALENIQDADLRAKALSLKKKQGGFTLLELLVVVAILAVLGGLAIGAYGDKTTQAARGGATESIAAVDSMIRTYQATAKVLPSNLDSLVCANPDGSAHTAATVKDFGGTSDLPGQGGGVGAKIAGKLTIRVPIAADTAVIDGVNGALNTAGIVQVRYAAFASATDDSCQTTATSGASYASGSLFYPLGGLAALDIPSRAFDAPTNDALTATNNRGRGFALSLPTGTVRLARAFQVWNPGTLGANNTKVGAQANDVLVVFGIGNNSSLVTDTSGGRVAPSAPFYGDVAKDKYNRYLALVKVGTTATVNPADPFAATELTASSKAQFIAVVDPKGDFLDEEYAEAVGQKL